MATHSEQLTDTDRETISKGKKKTMIGILGITLGTILVCVAGFEMPNNKTLTFAVVQDNAQILVLVFIAALFTYQIYKKYKAGTEDIVKGEKTVSTGTLRKKLEGRKKSIRMFYIDEDKIKVTAKIWAQYHDGDKLRMEYAPQSGYILSVTKNQ